MNRVKSGVPGLDDLIEGGFPESSSILVSGTAGTGKSILCMEYLYNGAKEYGEPGAYITLEEGAHNIWWNMQNFKWDLVPLERENKLKIYKFEPTPEMQNDPEAQVQRIVEKAQAIKAKRLVVDSITAFSFWLSDLRQIRFAIYSLIKELRKLDCTTLLTCETGPGRHAYSRFGVEEFLTDGVMQLYLTPANRAIFIRKMRGTNHSKGIHPVNITGTGLSIDSKEDVLWEALKD
ncbi:TPA: AAA family ATPase [Candidatus Micrarchaeota archaeon]|nr:AAA family ATPase [Candidatus Micrarchaeota archaeon]